MNNRRSLALVVCLAAAGGSAYGSHENLLESYHFRASEHDYGQPPSPLRTVTWDPDISDTSAFNSERHWEVANRLIGALRKAESRGDWLRAGRVCGELTELLSTQSWGTGEDFDDRVLSSRNDLYERWAREPLGLPLSYYIQAFPLSGKVDASTLDRIAANPKWGYVRGFAQYALASAEFDHESYMTAGELYARAASLGLYRVEEARIMEVRCLNTNEPGEFPTTERSNKAYRAVNNFLRDYPQSRFRGSALMWRAHQYLLSGKRVAACLKYLRVLREPTSSDEKLRLYVSFHSVTASLKLGEAKELSSRIQRNPELVQPYLESRLYSYDARPDKAGLKSLYGMAANTLARSKGVFLSAGLKARLAEIAYTLNKQKEALRLAEASLAAPASTEAHRDLAHFVRASVLMRLGKRKAAIAEYQRVIRDYPESYILPTARENLAILFEKVNRLGEAVDLYRGLGYDYDVRYLLDVKMSLRQVEAYTQSHRKSESYPIYRYSVGIRYMRVGRFDDAIRVFSAMSPAALKKLSGKGDDTRNGGYEKAGIDLYHDPLHVSKDLRLLTARVHGARPKEAWAKATYKLGSYYYDNRNLIFYNYAIWRGDRVGAFAIYWNDDRMSGSDRKALRTYQAEHECLLRVRETLLPIAERTPNSPYAPKALYRVACADARMNALGVIVVKLPFRPFAEAKHLMLRVAREYPRDPLAANAKKYAAVYSDEQTNWNRYYDEH